MTEKVDQLIGLHLVGSAQRGLYGNGHYMRENHVIHVTHVCIF